MNKINDIFVGIANKLPFAKEFFARNIELGSFELNTLFLVLVAVALVVILIIIIAITGKSNAKNKAPQPVEQADIAEDTAQPVVEEPAAITIPQPAAVTTPTQSQKAEEPAAMQPQETVVLEKPAEKPVTPAEKPVAKPAEKPVAKPAEKPVKPAKKPVAKPAEPQKNLIDAPEKSAEEQPLRLFKSQKTAPAVTQTAQQQKAPPEKEPDAAAEALAAKDDTKRTSGKFETVLKSDGYRFYLIANNGQLLFESTGYTSSSGAQKGIETFKKAVEGGNFVVDEDKFGRFRFILNKRYAGENYNTKAACESSIESVKNFSKIAAVVPYEYDDAAEKKYAAHKNTVISTVDWDAVEKEDAAKKPSGKFEIAKRADGYHYYLLANNGQLLFASNGYASAGYAKETIKNFKKAVYIGNFIIDEDKFGRFRFILRGAGFSTVYVGESYTTRIACEKIITSVKNFSRTAVIVP